jgi:hypothetical protein
LWVVDARGEATAVPNRQVAGHTLRTGSSGRPEAVLRVELAGVEPERARSALRLAALMSPWIAPGCAPEIGLEGEATWSVRVRIVDLAFRDRFVGTFSERLAEALGEIPSGGAPGGG